MDYVVKISPIVISIISLLISLKTHFARLREERPSPSYFMFIPSKVYFQLDDGNYGSILTLSPVSYEVITEQIVSGSTKNGIVKSILPINFSAKKGERDIIHDSVKLEEDFMITVETYPFLVIISEVEYKYKNKTHKDILMSTP